MDTMFFFWIFLLGLIVGSFLNSISFRYNTNSSVLKGRSLCMCCGHKLSSMDLIPLFSFLFLKGRCRYCKTKLSIQYPLVEIITGLVFSLSFIRSGFPVAIFWWVIWSLLIVISIYDFKHKIIPDGLVYSILLISFVSLLFSFHLEFTFINLIAGPVLFLPFAALWWFSNEKLMGLGDAKLFWATGWILGLVKSLSSLVISFWTGAIVSLFLIGSYKIFQLNRGSKGLTMKSEIPFGPFIVLGIFIVYFFGFDILSLNFLNF